MTEDPKKTVTQPSMSAADPMQRLLPASSRYGAGVPEGKPTTKFGL